VRQEALYKQCGEIPLPPTIVVSLPWHAWLNLM